MNNPHFGLGDLEIVKEITRKPTDTEAEHKLNHDLKRMVHFFSSFIKSNTQPLEPVEIIVTDADTVREAKQPTTKRRFTLG